MGVYQLQQGAPTAIHFLSESLLLVGEVDAEGRGAVLVIMLALSADNFNFNFKYQLSLVHRLPNLSSGALLGFQVSPDKKLVVASSADGSAYLFSSDHYSPKGYLLGQVRIIIVIIIMIILTKMIVIIIIN